VPNYLVHSIILTVVSALFCFPLPFAIAAIVYAAQVNKKLRSRDYAGAVQSSKNAKIWCWITFGAVAFLFILYTILGILGVFPEATP